MPTLVQPPTLTGFTTHYGVPVSTIGEDGELVALGHHNPRTVLAAFNAYARSCGFRDLADWSYPRTVTAGRVRHELFVVDAECSGCGPEGACRCPDIFSLDWWLRAADGDDRDAFPVTVWS